VTDENNPADQTDDERRAAGLSPEAVEPGTPSHGSLAPMPVKVSFWLWIASGVIYIAGYLIVLASKQTIINSIVNANKDPKISPGTIASSVTTLLWVLVIGAVVFAVLFALFAYKAREGTRSARTVLTVLFVLTLAFQFLLQLFSLVTLLAQLLALIALLLMYLPSVQGYFPKVGRKLP
jgi:divalent metal cation (Fe/Co/Zn/Cd) transporter